MDSAFDPSAFIQAEQSQAAASEPFYFGAPAEAPKGAEICEKPPVEAATIAEIAGIAGDAPGNLPWSPDLEAWAAGPRADWIKPDLWDEVTNEALVVSKRWGASALEQGWSMLGLFGCNPKPRAGRVDRNGLVATIVGLRSAVRLTAITADHAELVARGGVVMRYRPMIGPGSVPLWEGYSMRGGP